ncbi:MAG TPA: hypothetical protein VLG71_01765, partial [Candidatus Limnocylindria bacterium]|nr:hypothetical protein [Candidatus Limnocylindria bacterium]
MKLICGLILGCLSLQAADNKKTSPDGVHRGSMFTGKTHALGGGRPTVSGQSTAAASAAAPATSMPSSSPQQRSVVAPFNLPTAAPVAGATTPASVSPTASRAGSPTNTPAAAAATPTTSPVATAAPQHAAVPLLRLPRQSVYSATSHALGGPRRSSTAASEASAAAASAATAAAAHAGSASSAVTLARHKQNTGSPRSGIAGKSMMDEIGGRMAVIVEDNKNLLNELMSKVDFFVHREQDFDRI